MTIFLQNFDFFQIFVLKKTLYF